MNRAQAPAIVWFRRDLRLCDHAALSRAVATGLPVLPVYIDDECEEGAWQRGQTGYPLVDAGMRQLWHTGWMHNRVRMVVASFLVKDLLVD